MVGGQAVQAARLLRHLQGEESVRAGFQAIDVHLPRFHARVRSVPYVRTATNLPAYVARLLAVVPRYDVVHVFSASLWSYALWTLPVVLTAKAFGKRLIVNYRDGRAAEHMATWRSALPTLRLADAIVCPSGYLVDVFRDFGIDARSIFNILDFSQFPFRERTLLRPRFLTNRILEPLYNVECILRAFALVQRQRPEASLTIAHDGASRPALERLARDLGLQHTQFVGTVDYARVPALYDEADLYVTTPNADCMPGSLLECFASGVPVIATRVGGIPYILSHEETGLLVEPDDHAGVAAAALRLLDDPSLSRSIVRRARTEVRKYSWEGGVRDQWLALYAQLGDRLALARSPSRGTPSG
jgi:glycosyltransferase involved in cell wall biosynthesis